MTQNTLGALAADPIARLGVSHGYAINGDTAHLNADILYDESRLTGQQWFLQLWTEGSVKVAELALGVLPVTGSGYFRIEGTSDAYPPAGQQAHTVSMVLVNDRDGVCDQATYPYGLTIAQPRLNGTVCCSFTEQQITLNIDCIDNPRPADNVSGTLALELWSLDSPYAGGAWIGVPVASLVLGVLNGQCAWQDCCLGAHAAPLPAEGYLTLMLREWSPAGYVTRDYRLLAHPGATTIAADTVPAVPAAQTAAASTEKVIEKKVEKLPETKAVKSVEPSVAKPATKAKTPAAKGVSLNTASTQEIAAIKGISAGVAKAIVASRPYRAVDELLGVKGIGPKLLERLRSKFTL